MVSVQPWGRSVVAPQLGVAPDLGTRLDDAVALRPAGPAGPLAVAPARPAPAGRQLAATSPAEGESASRPRLGIAPARAVTPSGSEAPPAAPEPQPTPEPVPASTPPPAPGPVAVPVAAPPSQAPSDQVVAPIGKPASHGGHPSGPVAAGGGEVGAGEEEAPGEEAEGPEAEEEAGGEEAGEGGDDECTPPFVLYQEGVRHELLLCREGAAGDEAFYLVLDGERIGNLGLPYPE